MLVATVGFLFTFFFLFLLIDINALYEELKLVREKKSFLNKWLKKKRKLFSHRFSPLLDKRVKSSTRMSPQNTRQCGTPFPLCSGSWSSLNNDNNQNSTIRQISNIGHGSSHCRFDFSVQLLPLQQRRLFSSTNQNTVLRAGIQNHEHRTNRRTTPEIGSAKWGKHCSSAVLRSKPFRGCSWLFRRNQFVWRSAFIRVN